MKAESNEMAQQVRRLGVKPDDVNLIFGILMGSTW